jgi:hypothetical protein
MNSVVFQAFEIDSNKPVGKLTNNFNLACGEAVENLHKTGNHTEVRRTEVVWVSSTLDDLNLD